MYKPISHDLCYKQKLYYANVSGDKYKLFPYIKLYFKHSKHINSLKYKLKDRDNKIKAEKDKVEKDKRTSEEMKAQQEQVAQPQPKEEASTDKQIKIKDDLWNILYEF